MAVAAGRVPLKLLPCVLNVCMFVAFVAFAPFHSCQIFASLCIQGAINLAVFVLGSISASLHVQ